MKSVPEVQVTLSLPLFIAAESEHVTLTIVPEKYIFPIFKNANESPKVRLTGY